MARLAERLRDPVVWSESSQLVKTVVAAVHRVGARGHVFDLPQPFLAPWAALLTVHATVYRSLAHGLQQVAAAVLGVCSRSPPGSALGVNAGSLALALVAALAAGTTRALRDESTTAATTALVVLDDRLQRATRASSPAGCSTPRSASASACSSTSSCGRRCATAPRRGRWTSSTTASASCWPTWPAGCARAATRWTRTVDRPHARARPRRRRRVGRRAGRRARAAASTSRRARRRARAGPHELRAAPRAPGAGDRRDAEHGAHHRARARRRGAGIAAFASAGWSCSRARATRSGGGRRRDPARPHRARAAARRLSGADGESRRWPV